MGNITFNAGSVDYICPEWWGAIADGATNCYTGIQNAISNGILTKIPIKLHSGTYALTQTVIIYGGTRIYGALTTQYPINPQATTISFTPAILSNCFEVYNNGVDLVHNISIIGLNIVGTNANCRYGLDLGWTIYCKYADLTFDGFNYSIRCYKTINNKFDNIYLTGSTAALFYEGGSATTDVWTHCTFSQSLEGVRTGGPTIGIRFVDCIFEQLDNYGAYITKDTQSMMFINCYSEDVPYTNNAAGAMFKLGFAGASFVVENHLIINGGIYQGRNAGAVGSFVDADYCNGIMAGGFNVSRYTNIIKTTANTREASIVLTGYAGITWTNNILDETKVAGIYPNGVINSGTNSQHAKVKEVTMKGGANYPALFGVAWTPTISGSGTAGTYELSASTKCYYYQVDHLVTLFCRIILAGAVTGGGTGDVRIGNLPFDMSASYYTGITHAKLAGIAFTGSYAMIERLSSSATSIVYLYGVDNAGVVTNVPISAVGASDEISFVLQYMI